MRKIIDKINNNKPLKIIINILKTLLYVVVVLLLIVILVQKVSSNNKTIFGFRIFTVASESMKGEYDIGDILISKNVSENELKVGDNITYLGEKGEMAGLVITHKIVKIEEREGKKYFTTKGIKNTIEDPEITYSQIYGKVIYKTAILSYIATLMTNELIYYGLFVIVGIMISYEIVSAIFESKREEEDDADGTTE